MPSVRVARPLTHGKFSVNASLLQSPGTAPETVYGHN